MVVAGGDVLSCRHCQPILKKKNMFRLNWKNLKFVTYKCSPHAEGNVSLIETIAFAVVFTVFCLLYDDVDWVIVALGALIIIGELIYSLYLRFWKRTLQERTITLGTFAQKLYLNSRPLFFVYEIAKAVFLYVAFVYCTILLDSSFGTDISSSLDRMHDLFAFSIFAIDSAINDYIDYREYFRLPANLR